MRRAHFIAGATALGAAGCSSSSGTTGTGVPPVSGIGPGHVSDLRYGSAPVPVTGNGYDPAGDAAALIIPGTPSPATSPIPGVQLQGSLGPDERMPSAAARTNISAFAHTGNIGKPLISIAGAADMFITPGNNATPYLAAVNAAGKGSRYWQYLVSGGTHVDTFAALGYGLQPQLKFAWAAFNQLVNLVEHGVTPAGAGTQQPVSQPTDIHAAARATRRSGASARA